MKAAVNAWMEEISLPTYGTGKPEKNPMFLEKRVYQGSSGVVYPHPVIEKILDDKKDKTYQAVFLENRYLKIMILPELGGRVQMAYDKIRERHFVYYNQVIKPALVGLTGPWISGGIEFNWPQHHRPSTFSPVDYMIREENGSVTVWVNEVEIMFRTKGMAGFTLYPDKAYLEVQGKLSNRTPFPQTFLWWANPAVKANDHYQSVFPPDVHAVFDHGKRDVSSFPIAKGTYYKVNYAPGTDISRYKNIPVPTSYMAVSSEYDFIGGYEHDAQAGILHVANHHISPGKKQWTWGNGDFGRAWDRNLTDEDGPYVELMTGVFTDNQPDFSWLLPNEEKVFKQYFMPYSQVGMVKNASKEAIVSLDIRAQDADIRVYTTAHHDRALIRLSYRDKLVYERRATVSPEQTVQDRVPLPDEYIREPHRFLLEVKDAAGRLLVRYQPEQTGEKEIPPPATAVPPPEAVPTQEELYLNGLHLEQYRHATFDPREYYLEALKRDPADSRNNQAMGLWYLRRGKFREAIPYFSQAIKRLTGRNPNAYDVEAYYHFGCTLKFQGHLQEAYAAFYKASWGAAWQDSAFLMLARIDTAEGALETALDHVNRSLSRNTRSHQAWHLKAVLMRKLNKHEKALQVIDQALAQDPFNYGCLFERYLARTEKNSEQEAKDSKNSLKALIRGQASTYIEYALDYAHAGLYPEAIRLLGLHLEDTKDTSPMIYYHLGWFSLQSGSSTGSAAYFSLAAKSCPDYCFPNRMEDMMALEAAVRAVPGDAKAFYYLGNYWYDKRMYDDAVHCWEESARLDPGFPTVLRNLSLAYYNKEHNPEKALQAMEKAFDLDPGDARVLMELDQLRKLLGFPPQQRLEMLEACPAQTAERDDLYLERATLYNRLGDHETARKLITSRKFHPWEGGEGLTVRQYLIAHTELARKALQDGDPGKALELLAATEKYPENLGEGKLFNTPENDIHYLQGCACEQLGKQQDAIQKFREATAGSSEPVQAIFYNDPQPDKICYQGLAWKKLGEQKKAERIFTRLRAFGKTHLQDSIRIDYFAVSLPDLLVFDQDLNQKNRIHCHYLMGLGCLGLGLNKEAEQHFRQVLTLDINHQGAVTHLGMIGVPHITAKSHVSNQE